MSRREFWPVTIVSSLASFLVPFMTSSINIALPSIGAEFRMDAVLLGWIATSYLLTIAVCMVPAGRLADIYGRRKFFLGGLILFTISSLFASLTTSTSIFLIMRVLQGIGSAMIFGTSVAILISVVSPDEKGKALGINTAAVYIGLSMGPVLGGLLTHHLGWRSIFWINVPLGILTVIVTLWQIRGEWAEARGETFDLGGSLIFGAAITSIIYSFSLLPAPAGTWLFVAGVATLGLFAAYELRICDPLIDIHLFQTNRVFTFSSLAAFINYSATAGVGFLMSLYLQYIKHLSPREAGLVLVAQPAMMALFSPAAGRLSDKVEPGIIASIGMALSAAAVFILATLGDGSTYGFIVGILVLFGVGFALFSSPNTNAVMSSIESRRYGIASALLGTMRSTGQMFSLGITMLTFSLMMGRAEISPVLYPAFLKSMKLLFIIFGILSVLGIFASLARGKLRKRE